MSDPSDSPDNRLIDGAPPASLSGRLLISVAVFLLLGVAATISWCTQNSAREKHKEDGTLNTQAPDEASKNAILVEPDAGAITPDGPLPSLPAQVATPAALNARKLAKSDVGTLTKQLPGAPAPITYTLRGVGFNRCRDGWRIQGFYHDPQAQTADALQHTSALILPLHTIGLGTVEVRDARLSTRTIEFTLTEYTSAHIKGSLKIMDEGAEAPTLLMDFDAPTRSVLPEKGLGQAGCFHTGTYHMLSAHRPPLQGPVTATYQPHPDDLYTVQMDLSERYAITVGLKLAPEDFKKGKVIDVELAAIQKNFTEYPARALFDERVDPRQFNAVSTIGLDWNRTVIGSGKLAIEMDGSVERPLIRVTLSDLTLPSTWTEPWGGLSITKIDAAARVIHGARDQLIPPPL